MQVAPGHPDIRRKQGPSEGDRLPSRSQVNSLTEVAAAACVGRLQGRLLTAVLLSGLQSVVIFLNEFFDLICDPEKF
jgi:hypothetical protein